MLERGKIISIEGTDGSGKATQTIELVKNLLKEGVLCERISFPRYHTPTGRVVSQTYLGKKRKSEEGDVAWFGKADKVDPKIASMYYAADRLATKNEIMEIINSGKHLILDRWVESNMAHQGAKETDQGKRDDLMKFVHDLEYGLLNLPRPDLTIFLYVPHKVGVELKEKSGEEKDEHEKSLRHLRRTEGVYPQLAKKLGWVTIDCAPDGTIDSLRTPEEIAEEVYSHVIQLIKS